MEGNTIVTPPKVGRFQIRGTIGEGAFSIVKLALDELTKKYYACKVIPKNRIASNQLVHRFEVEIRVNQQLHHTGIVQIVDLLRDNINYYIFMEFCPNGDFFQYIIDRQRLPEEDAAFFIKQVLIAMKYVHSLGIAHRDLKPENLLIDSTGKLKISDFGLSSYVSNNGLVNTPCGSPCYASPECISGESYDGRKSDVWSLGVISYASLTGQLPWTKRNQQQLFDQIRKGEYEVPEYLTEDSKNFIQCLMTVDVNNRITIEEALNHPWILGNCKDDVVGQVILPIVGIKKVDNFFDEDLGISDVEVEEFLIYKNRSMKFHNFSLIDKIIVNNVKNNNFMNNQNNKTSFPPIHSNQIGGAYNIINNKANVNISRPAVAGQRKIKFFKSLHPKSNIMPFTNSTGTSIGDSVMNVKKKPVSKSFLQKDQQAAGQKKKGRSKSPLNYTAQITQPKLAHSKLVEV